MKDIDPRFAGTILANDRMVVEATVWDVQQGVTTFRFVNLDHAVSIDVGDGSGTLRYEPMPFTRSEVSSQSDLQIDRMSITIPNLEMLVSFSDDAQRIFASDFVLNGVLDRASVWLYLINLRSLSVMRHSWWDVVGASDIRRETVTIELQSAMGRAVRPTPRTLIQEGCNNQLFDQWCTLLRAAYTATGNVVSGDRLHMHTALAAADFYYDLGQCTFTSGRNVGATRTVGKYLNAGGTVAWNAPLRFDVAAGDRFSIVPGCPKTYLACQTKFLADNTANIRSFSNVPNTDQILM